MSSPEQGKQSLRLRLPRILRSRPESATNFFARQTVQLGFIALPDMSGNQAIGGVVPPLQSQRRVGSAAYEGLKTVLQGLYDCSDMFLPLKAAAGGLLTVIKIIDVRGSISRA